MRGFALAVAFAAAPLPGQRYVVDATGGGNFLDLPTAVAAVPDGATLLVRPGSYTQFNVVGKGITVIGDAATCTLTASGLGSAQIANISAGKRVVISGFTLGFVAPIQVSSCAGSVVLRDLRGLPFGSTVQGCADVHLLELQGVGSGSLFQTPPPFLAISGSSVEVMGCLLDGGSFGVWVPSTPQTGATAVTVSQSRVVIDASQLKGGTGSPGLIGNGGAALAVTVSSAVTILGASSFTGGNGGYHSGYAPGGSGINCDTTATVLMLGGTLAGGAANGKPFVGPVTWQMNVVTPVAKTSGPVLPSTTIGLKLTALPGVPVLLWLGQSTWFQPYPLLPAGVLTVQPQLLLGPFTTDPLGAISVPLAVPASWPGATPLFAQFATLDVTSNTIAVSGSLMLCGVY